jgi:hypothetical protein
MSTLIHMDNAPQREYRHGNMTLKSIGMTFLNSNKSRRHRTAFHD